jgi:hypothetical protein
MFRHRNAILRESTETKELKPNTPVQVLIDITGIVENNKVYFKILK